MSLDGKDCVISLSWILAFQKPENLIILLEHYKL